MNLPQQCAALLTRWIVPLFLAYNIVGWWWLPAREVNRSKLRENYTKLDEQNLAGLGRALWAAWLVGLLIAMAILAAIAKLYPNLLQKSDLDPIAGYVAGVVGLVAGLARGALPALSWFRRKPALTQRRILSGLMTLAAGISVSSIILYYSSGDFLRCLIAAGYLCMLIGYALPYVFQVGQ